MTKVIDVSDSDGFLVVIGKALVLPSSSTDGVDLPMEGSFRYNPITKSMQSYVPNAGWKDLSSNYRISMNSITSPASSQILLDYVVTQNITFPENFEGSKLNVGTFPSATYSLIVQKNAVTIGTLSISPTGIYNLLTVGNTAKNVAVGDVISIIAPSSVDASIARIRLTLVAN